MLLLSIRPDFADAILTGSKTVEFRRRLPRRVQPGSELAIYASAPICALVGMAKIDRFLEATPDELWRECRQRAGIDYDRFREYFAGTDRAVGIVLSSVQRLQDSLDLDSLRREWPGFHPPQQFAYLSQDRQDRVRSIAFA